MEPSLSHEILRVVENSPLEELTDLFKILACKVYEHRRMHRGFVPFEIFEQCLGIGGIAVGVEVVLSLPRQCGIVATPFALKRRKGEAELSWTGMFQIPGAMARTNVGIADLLDKVSNEIFGNGGRRLSQAELLFAGNTIQNEPERLVTCWTPVFTLPVPTLEGLNLDGEWKVYPGELTEHEVVDHHRETLAWLDSPFRPMVADLRLHRDSNWLEMRR